MHDGTARVTLNGEPVNQMARIGTFSEEVVCPAEQVVKVRDDLPFTHAAVIGCSVARIRADADGSSRPATSRHAKIGGCRIFGSAGDRAAVRSRTP
jgi:Zn-dependent alcohol dehydrogenase